MGRLVLVLMVFSAPLRAQQRPLLTEDPESVGEGLILLETGIGYAWDQPFPVSGLKGNLLSVPQLGLSFGMGPNAEIQIDGVSLNHLSISDRSDAPLSRMLDISGGSTRSYGDMVVGAKVKVVSEGDRMPAVAMRFATRLPNLSNESGLGLDTIDFFQSLLVGKTIKSVRVVGNVGVGILSDPIRGDRQNDVLTYGVSLARAFREGAEIVGDVNGRVSTRRGTPPSGTESAGRITFGIRYTRGSVRFDGGVFTGLTSRDPSAGVTGGITWVFESILDP